MPAIRDQSWNYTSVATGTTLVLPTPAYVVGDLLIAVFMADTGTSTWTVSAPPSGAAWVHITGSPTTNTCQLICMWKYAVASEPASYTFTGSVSESYNGAMISIRDVHASTPFGATPVINFTTQTALAKFAMQQITTNTNNSLVLYASANSGAGVPSFLEGPAFGLVGADGLAESIGIGWGFKQTAGLTSNAVTVSNVAAGAGVKLAIQIAPPAGGAAVIPAYVAADSSLYLDPINGTTAYNGNTALAATADTNFGTSIGGLTTGDATVSAVADVGINSFHSVGRLTSVTGVTTPGGAELVFATANRPNVTGKNVLVHVGPSTEGQLQRFSSVASGRGIWFGMRNAAGTNKVYQVYGVEKGSTRHVPVVINESATSTKHTAGTLAPSAIQAFGFWVSSGGVGTTAWDFASLWALDTTTICGGNAAEPIDVAQLYQVVSVGKERKSVVLQGSSQVLCLQPIQFGNGGTDVTYLDLDATAIEFPRQYNAATKDVTYHSVNNVAGITYLAGASDTIKHTNAVVSSASDYHWRIHASSSASASYDFKGLSLIGAGDVQLRAVTTFNTVAFTSCTTITQNAALITKCTFTDSYLVSGAPNNISNSSFVSSGVGHAIEITTANEYTFTGNTFTGYGASNTTNAAIYNNSGGAVILNITGGGSTPTIRNGAGASTTVNSNVQITLTGLQNPSEVRVFLAGTTTEVSGTGNESVITGSHAFSVSSGTAVDITILSLGYQNTRIKNFSTTADTSVPVSQVLDRQYQNL